MDFSLLGNGILISTAVIKARVSLMFCIDADQEENADEDYDLEF